MMRRSALAIGMTNLAGITRASESNISDQMKVSASLVSYRTSMI
jgi:hypothetical protein